jgi:hypothetical protein
MSSSDGTGSVGKSATRKTGPAKTAARAETPAPGPDAHDESVADPWFGPGPKVAYVDAGLAETDGQTVQGEWFLPTGRAGLLPDSMSESWDDDGTAPVERAQAAGAPPWGRDGAAAAAGEPPPWETGPWPGPGESAQRQPRPVVADHSTAESAATDLEAGTEPRQRSRLMMIGGAAVLVLIVVIVVVVVATSGGPGGCATYPAAVRQAYARAMSDLSSRVPASVQGADLERAASLANSSAAAAGQITARTALFTMASDLDEASSDVARHRPITPDLQQRLTADGTALPRSC